MPAGQKPTHRILAKPIGSEKNSLEIGAIWSTANKDVTSVVFKRENLARLVDSGAELKAIIVPNRPKAEPAAAAKKQAAKSSPKAA